MSKTQSFLLGAGLGFVLVLALLGQFVRHPRTIPVIRVKALPDLFGRRWKAWTLPPLGIVIVEEQISPELLAHEIEHWRQWEQAGTFAYAVDYGLQVLRYGYHEAPMELQARAAELLSAQAPLPTAHSTV